MSTVTEIRRHEEVEKAGRAHFGFWLYLMTDCVLFAALFATFAVMRNATNNGPSGAELFDLQYVFIETMLLLTSSFMCGLVLLSAARREKEQTLVFMTITCLLGAFFVSMEIREFQMLVAEGASWQSSGFLSSYFALVATHGLHIIIGLIWLVTLMLQLIRNGFTKRFSRRLGLFSLFWHFLDVVWIFIFSIVYLWSGRL